jgi:hypothetical protein
MPKQKVYKITDKQMKLIVENQKKGSPQLIVTKKSNDKQLQTEILDSLGNLFTKILTGAFKVSVNAIKYLMGVGVNVYYGEQYSKGGKYPVVKNNPLAPLSITKATLTGLPENYQNIFTKIYEGILGISKSKEELKKTTENEPVNTNQPNDVLSGLESSVEENMVFNDTKGIKYPIKFEFSNLSKNDKKNATVMMSTWNLVFDVDASGKASETSTLTFNLVGFPASGPSLSRLIAAGKEKKEKESEFLSKALMKFESEAGNNISLIFSSSGQAEKFQNAMKKQIDTHMKVMISEVNTKIGTKNLIKIPNVSVVVDKRLIGSDPDKGVNPKTKLDQTNNDLKEMITLIEKYQQYVNLNPKDTNAKNFLQDLQIKARGLIAIKKELEMNK